MPDRVLLRQHHTTLPPRPLGADVDLGRVGAYHGYAGLVERWLAAAGARVHHIGHSVARAPLFALELGPADAPATSVVMAGLHPIEWIGVEVLLGLSERLRARPPVNRRVLLLPLVNVDGYRQVEDDLRAGQRRWRRTNAQGVDLNRNWPRPGTARGAAHASTALSEPETAAVAAALDAAHARAPIDVAVSLHSIGRMLLLPGGRWQAPDAAARVRRAARAVAARLPLRYRVRQVSRWLPGLLARGIEIDHLHHRYGAVSLLVECSLGGLRLRDPASWIHPFRWYNPPVPAREVEAVCAGIEPLVRGELA